MSSAALSLEISHLVTRALRGEAFDPAEKGQELALRFPDLGMSGELIGKGIERTAEMMEVVLGRRTQTLATPVAEAIEPSRSTPARLANGAHRSLDQEISAAIHFGLPDAVGPSNDAIRIRAPAAAWAEPADPAEPAFPTVFGAEAAEALRRALLPD